MGTFKDIYSNYSSILSTYNPIDAQRLDQNDINTLLGDTLSTNFGTSDDVVEFHVYDLSGNWLTGTHTLHTWKTDTVNKVKHLSVNVHTDIRSLGFSRGEYKVVYNFLRDILGSYIQEKLYVAEISPSRQELRLSIVNKDSDTAIQNLNDFFSFLDTPQQTTGTEYQENWVVNFGLNNIFKVVNVARATNNDILIKLYKPLPNSFILKDHCWLALEARLPYVDDIILYAPALENPKNTIGGPNFDLDVDYRISTETDYKDWNDLLTKNLNTSQQLIDKYLSGSADSVKLNIDYTEFKNYVHYSSAEERVRNFFYKLQQIENYNILVGKLINVTGSSFGNLLDTFNKRAQVINTFDDFEKYLYFQSGSQNLYTFTTASVEPWPKQNSSVAGPLTWVQAFMQWNQANTTWATSLASITAPLPSIDGPYFPYNLYPTTSSKGVAYYDSLVSLAQDYDIHNNSGLIKAIPEALSSDSDNEQFNIFVYMIGQHFDIMWTYINYLTRINTREEHPSDGISNDLIYDVAKSLGWRLSHGKQGNELWQYALGNQHTSPSGSNQSTGIILVKTQEQVTKEIWRRILNNLPYIYKTKGTTRSIRALAACYGVPSTILSIKEYGGPSVQENTPQYIHNVFSYALKTNQSQYAKTKWYPVKVGNTTRFPDTIEMRINCVDEKTSKFNYWGYNKFTLFEVGTGTSSKPKFFVTLEKSGSYQTGNLHFYLSGSKGYLSSSIKNVPLFDGNFSSVILRRKISNDSNTTNQKYEIFYKKPLYGNFVVNSSSSIIVSGSLGVVSQSYNGSWTTATNFYLGSGSNPDNKRNFTGSIQELRYWSVPLSQSVMEDHSLAASAYNSNTPTGSYLDLALRIPFIYRQDNATTSSISSAHTNQTITTFSGSVFPLSASLVGYSHNSGSYWESFTETYYTNTVSLGATNIYSNKIRIDRNKLIKPLSSKTRSEKSSFDLKEIDSNKIGVYFSPQNSINEDIFNELGYVDLDDYIGNPSDDYKVSYNDLKQLSQAYWKKYSESNDMSAYIRIFSLYDFSLFKQIEQLLPARTNPMLGLLIEPNVLERSKVSYRQPSLINDTYKMQVNTSRSFVQSAYMDSLTQSINIQYNPTYAPSTYSTTGLTWSGSKYIKSYNAYYQSRSLEPVITSSRPSITKTVGGKSVFYSTGFLYPSKVTQFTGSSPAGSSIWVNTDYVTGSKDGRFVSAAHKGIGSVVSYVLNTSKYNFNIPAGSTIMGIQLELNKEASNTVTDYIIGISRILTDTPTGSSLASVSSWPSSETTVYYGGNTQLWGQTWQYSDINSSSFSVQIRTSIGSAAAAYIDSIGINVFYKLTSSFQTANTQESFPTGILNHRYYGCKVTSTQTNQPSLTTPTGEPAIETIAVNNRQVIITAPSAKGNLTLPISTATNNSAAPKSSQ